MYWYPFSEEEEDRAWAQAKAQAETEDTDGTKKFIGNLGEIAVNQYLSEYGESSKYLNKEAMDNRRPEYEPVDFKIGRSGMKADVKTTSDIRKFDPVAMYHQEEKYMPGPAREGYPKVDINEADIFIFVLISQARDTEPGSQIYSIDDVDEEESDFRQNLVKARSGNRVAAILGWMYSMEFVGEMVGNMNQGGRGGFTRMAIRDMYELLLRTDALPKV